MTKKKAKQRRGMSGNPAKRAEAAKLAEEGTLICAVCRAPLDWTDVAGATVFSHAVGTKDIDDHEPKPTIGKPSRAATVCDFCGTTGISWNFVTEGVVFVPYEGQDEDSPQVEGKAYDERWGACDRCAPLVKKGNLAAILDRFTFIVGNRRDLSEAHRVIMRRQAKQLIEAFFRAKPTGPFPLDQSESDSNE
ncbi:hypothetical protein [Nonomuraea sp. SYSU D8015]|uniref:hypothetical protein n=1 Tax=Nonomuraea sp. SYSU D8015 TaxID=2593644 RepID=UPI001661085D|nr:hypothetical protein [Nonomuraea sp. SYSU D8015]